MVAAIGASPIYSAQLPAASTGGLRVELAKYEKELSNCVNCASATTTEGQQEIQRLTSEIARLKARIEEAARNASPENRANVSAAQANAENDRSAAHAGLAPQAARADADATAGSRIDILA